MPKPEYGLDWLICAKLSGMAGVFTITCWVPFRPTEKVIFFEESIIYFQKWPVRGRMCELTESPYFFAAVLLE